MLSPLSVSVPVPLLFRAPLEITPLNSAEPVLAIRKIVFRPDRSTLPVNSAPFEVSMPKLPELTVMSFAIVLNPLKVWSVPSPVMLSAPVPSASSSPRPKTPVPESTVPPA